LKIERGVDAQSAVVEFGLVLGEQAVANKIDVIRCIFGLPVHRRELERRGFSCLHRDVIDGVVLIQGEKDHVAPLQGTLGMAIGREVAGAVDHAGEQRRFRKIEAPDVLAEIGDCAFSEAADVEGAALTEIDLIDVDLEDLLFG